MNMGNNVADIELGPLGVDTIFSDLPLGNFAVVKYPKNGGVIFVAEDKLADTDGFGKQSFGIFESFDGGGINIGNDFTFGNEAWPCTTLEIVGLIGAGEVFAVVDTNFGSLFGVTGDGNVNLGRVQRVGAAPVAVAGAGLGSTGSAVVQPGGTDSAFQVAVTAGGAGLASGNIYTVTFSKPFASLPVIVFSAQGAANTSVIGLCVNSVTTAGFSIFVPSAPVAGGPQFVNFLVVG